MRLVMCKILLLLSGETTKIGGEMLGLFRVWGVEIAKDYLCAL